MGRVPCSVHGDLLSVEGDSTLRPILDYYSVTNLSMTTIESDGEVQDSTRCIPSILRNADVRRREAAVHLRRASAPDLSRRAESMSAARMAARRRWARGLVIREV